jgi:hypothetical protein
LQPDLLTWLLCRPHTKAVVAVQFNPADPRQVISCGRDKCVVSSPARCPLLQQYLDTLLEELVEMDYDEEQLEKSLRWQARRGLLQVGLHRLGRALAHQQGQQCA